MTATAIYEPLLDTGVTIAAMPPPTDPPTAPPTDFELAAAMHYARPLAVRILRNHPEAIDDVLQAAALKAIVKWRQFGNRCTYRVWFTRIVINTALMYLRSSRRPNLTDSLDATLPGTALTYAEVLPARDPSPLDRAIERQHIDLLLAEIAALSPVKRQEMLRQVGGDDYALSGPRKATRWRAIQKIRAAFTRRGVISTVIKVKGV